MTHSILLKHKWFQFGKVREGLLKFAYNTLVCFWTFLTIISHSLVFFEFWSDLVLGAHLSIREIRYFADWLDLVFKKSNNFKTKHTVPSYLRSFYRMNPDHYFGLISRNRVTQEVSRRAQSNCEKCFQKEKFTEFEKTLDSTSRIKLRYFITGLISLGLILWRFFFFKIKLSDLDFTNIFLKFFILICYMGYSFPISLENTEEYRSWQSKPSQLIGLDMRFQRFIFSCKGGLVEIIDRVNFFMLEVEAALKAVDREPTAQRSGPHELWLQQAKLAVG